MLNFMIVIAVIGQFIAYDLLLHVAMIFRPGRIEAVMDWLQRKAVHKIFSTFACYRHWGPTLENRTGVELPERFILVANHQSIFDIPIVWKLLPQRCKIRFIAKRELGFGVPLVSSCLHIQGHALIKRKGAVVQAMKSLERFGRRSRSQGFSPVLFPEGTRSRTGELGVFHTAGFRKLVDLDPLPVLVAAIDGGFRVAKLGDLFKNLGRYPYTVSLEALLPAPAGKKQILATLEEARSIIDAALKDLRLRS
ncbi:MAG: lysophospholipid acyltransferase family protein [Rectinemataceae bacterium]